MADGSSSNTKRNSLILHHPTNLKGGWNAAIFIIFVEFAERFAYQGLASNLIQYLTNVLNEPITQAAKDVNTWVGASSLFPLLGGFIADSYLGRFNTILLSSVIYFAGMVFLTLSVTAFKHKLLFFLALYVLAIGDGGHKPCVQTFAADQFDEDTPEEKDAKSSFFNWWYLGIVAGSTASVFVVIYLQEIMDKENTNGPLHFDLNTGAKIPSVGLGTWKAPPGVVGDAVIAAVKAGYRHIDCARIYDNEKEVGEALKTLFSTGVVQRSEMFITSKLWISDCAPEDVSKALTRTLEDLKLDYIDLYLMHWPFRTKPGSRGWDPEIMAPLCLPETWNAMEGLFASGQARAIGVSNFSTKKLQDLLGYAKIPPAVNQVECHPVWQQPALHNLCKSTGVHLTAYCPLGSPGSWVKGEILKEPLLIEIAEKLHKSPAQVALRWGLQSGHSVLPKSVNESRIKENLSLFDWCLPPELFSKLSQIHQQRLLRNESAVHETCSPYKSLEELWDGEI